ncbi:ATP-binding cassette subfamily B protein [Actinomadura cellulosilytica]|uniref:Fatty acid ABC transporter ATP-binding/permease protein n=2 Tax=Thermomonospora cellulosilytica TaxID=1411118 RepID=A0A7W3N252_9ACTN|nr:ABC transporter ATP-binding protein [Thermomonospora cellulosilytica]MBA9006131.1 ATP-binding cassette subfamily B protein [Thermomonospora cellulosilytica]
MGMPGMPGNGWQVMASFRRDRSVTSTRLKPGTVRRIAGYARPYVRELVLFLALNALAAVIVVAGPLLLKAIIDHGVLPRRSDVVVWLALAVAGLALVEAVLSLAQRWYSARIGEGLIYDLRTQVFDHVQRMPVAFFMRAQTGSLTSRLNTDVIGAQRALTTTLQSVVSNVISLVLVLAAMFWLSWQVTVIALVLLPIFIVPAKWVGKRLQHISREQMQLDAEMSSLMTERFNVAGAMLAKLYGRPEDESRMFSERAGRVRDIGVVSAMYGRVFFVALTLVAALATAMVYGVGGVLVVQGGFQLGTLVALAALLTRMYGPLTALSNVQVDVMTALVSFDRVFEVLDLEPMIGERPDAVPLRRSGDREAVAVEFDHVGFRYPAADEVSLASLESIARTDVAPGRQVLRDVTFTARPGELVALVGPSGAGKTTITHLVSRLYDVTEGAVRLDGRDVRDVTLQSLRDTVGVVAQDPHLFHDSIRENLRYARPDATDEEIVEALRGAQIWDLVEAMPDGLDTVVGERGYRLSGGEKQRLAIARLLLKAPSVVILDEATAHLDSESEAAVQRALKTALAGRTSLVIAHRLSTIREADQILVVDGGRIAERGRHEELLLAGGLYADLYRTQFAQQASGDGRRPARLGAE